MESCGHGYARYSCEICNSKNELHKVKRQLEAAEAKLRELEMQEPVAYLTDFEGSKTLSFSHPRIGAISKPLYAKPFPAPKQEEK